MLPIDGLSLVPTLTARGEQEQHRYLDFTGGKRGGYVVRSGSETREDKRCLWPFVSACGYPTRRTFHNG